MKAKPSHMQLFVLDNHLYCYHCGDCLKIGLCLPVRVDLMAKICKAFVSTHRRCKKGKCGDEVKASNDQRWEEWMKQKGKKSEADVKYTVTIG